jgi:hypothetical protein
MPRAAAPMMNLRIVRTPSLQQMEAVNPRPHQRQTNCQRWTCGPPEDTCPCVPRPARAFLRPRDRGKGPRRADCLVSASRQVAPIARSGRITPPGGAAQNVTEQSAANAVHTPRPRLDPKSRFRADGRLRQNLIVRAKPLLSLPGRVSGTHRTSFRHPQDVRGSELGERVGLFGLPDAFGAGLEVECLGDALLTSIHRLAVGGGSGCVV